MTGPGSSPSNVPDLAALREKAEARHADPYERLARYEELDEALTSLVDDLRAEIDALKVTLDAKDGGPVYHAGRLVSALKDVDRLLAENERLREALEEIASRKHGLMDCVWFAERALAGSPAANEEQQ